MSYPILTSKRADQLAAALRAGDGEPDDLIEWIDGFEVDTELIQNASQKAKTELGQRFDLNDLKAAQREALDARIAAHVHAALKDLPPQVLDDRGFWRWLALFPFRWFLELRRKPGERYSEGDYGGGDRSVRQFHDYQYIVKAYRRGQIAFDIASEDDQYERATRIVDMGERDIDVWDSHFLRTKIGDLREVTHSIYDEVTEPFFGREPIREYAKLITRERHNVLLDIYDYDQARAFAKAKRTRVMQLRPPGAEPEMDG